jgi:leader peptidase (prepilin peptidase) / N-methyltransferase
MFFIIVFFGLGAIVASFVGVVVARFNTGQSFLVGRSHCDSCNKELSSLDLVPIISYVVSGRRTRCCGTRLSAIAPITEFLLGCLFVFEYLHCGFGLTLACELISFSVLLALVLYDLIHHILPPSLLILFIIISSVSGFVTSSSVTAFLYSLFVAFCIALFLALIHFFSRGRALGFADAPLAFGLALLVGPAALPGFVFSFWIGAGIGIALLAYRPRGFRMNSEVPFAPFLAAGFLLAYFTQWNPFVFTALSH